MLSALLSYIPSPTTSPISTFFTIALIYTIIRLTIIYFTTIRFPANLPRFGESPQATSFRWKNRLRYYTDAQALFREAYEQYSKHNKTVLIPGLGFRDEVILPASSYRWLAGQPDHIINMYDGFIELDQIEASLPHEDFVRNPWQGNLVRTGLNGILETIMVGLSDELKYAFDTRFGMDVENWKEINVYDTVAPLIAQASSRFTVGLPLCRNEQYLKETIKWTNRFILNAGLCGMFPLVLRPLARRIAFIPMYFSGRRVRKLVAPLYNERVALLSSPKSPDEPQDHFQLILRYAQEKRPDCLNLTEITNRLLISNQASYHQTTMMVVNLLLNIIGSDQEYNTIAILREEVESVLKANNGKWTKGAVSQMWKLDSCNRETLRLQSFGGRALLRKVSAKEGLLTEDGILIPQGALLSILNWARQTDSETYDEPLKFNPFRFSKIREEELASSSTTPSTPPQTFVTTSEQFLPFGHGRHACPGRFLVDIELKMVLAYVVVNYDLKFPDAYHGKRPENKWIAEGNMPPFDAKILVRRRGEIGWAVL